VAGWAGGGVFEGWAEVRDDPFGLLRDLRPRIAQDAQPGFAQSQIAAVVAPELRG
jgi:hypothetical protein